MKILIHGASPLGAYLAAHFQFLAQDTLWYVDTETADAIQRAGGIQAIGARGRRFAKGVRVTASADEAFSHEYDLLFMVMPNYAIADALRELMRFQTFMAKPPTVVSLQRGIGGYERIASVFGARNVIRGALTCWIEHPLLDGKPAPEIFVRLPSGGIAIADNHRLSKEVAALLYAAYLPTMLGKGREIAWSALLWQLQGNAIPALIDLPTADVYASESLWAIEYKMLIEALGVIQALNIRLVDLPGAPVRRLATQLQTIPMALLPKLIVRNPAPPSLRAELVLGIPRSEAAYLNGAIPLHANDLTPKLTAPINYVLAITLEDIASGRALWRQFQHDPRSLEALVNIATLR
jgi:ketopantoate reductase